jgi:hypothetical protein
MKFSTKLNEFDILDLLNEYYSELRKLRYKSEYVNLKIAELEERYKSVKMKSVTSQMQMPEEAIESTSGAVDTTFEREVAKDKKPRKGQRKPYPLSDWDKMIIQGIEETGRALSSKTIFNQVKEKATNAGIYETEEKAKAKINQCLVKLTKRRNDLVKVNYKGRGFAYALPQFLDERGRVKKEHQAV